MDLAAFFKAEFAEHHDTARRTEAALSGAFAGLVSACVKSIRAGGKLMLFGNGGSAADAQHLATELTVRYKSDRAAIAAVALTTDTSALTAAGNDLGFDMIFARQIEALGRPGDIAIAISTSGKSPNVIEALGRPDDVAIAISTSGKSPNVIAALRQAKAMKLVTAALGGKGGGDLAGLADHLLVVPSDITARIQEMHITLGQMLCGALEIELGLVKPGR